MTATGAQVSKEEETWHESLLSPCLAANTLTLAFAVAESVVTGYIWHGS